MARAFASALALAFLRVASCQETLAPAVGALAQVGNDGETEERTEDAAAEQGRQQRLNTLFVGVDEAFNELAGKIGERTWKETTPTEQETVNATIGNIATVMSEVVKQDFEATQRAIADAVNTLAGKTKVALDMKKWADDADGSLVACRDRERQALIDTLDKLEQLTLTRQQKEEVCAKKDEARNLSWSLLAVNEGLCDFSDVSTEGICLGLNDLHKEVAEKNVVVEANQKLYQQLAQECSGLMDKIDGLIRETTLNNVPGNTAFTTKRLACDKENRKTQVAMCTFGDRLQEKCQAKSDVDSLTVKVYHQLEDRVAQWRSGQLIKCKLMRFQNGEKLTAMNAPVVPTDGVEENCAQNVYVNKDGAIKTGCIAAETPVDDLPCEKAVNFERDIGTMDYMLPAADAQMTADRFSCSESAFKFTGFKWKTGAAAADYVKEDFQADVQLTPLGTHPFEFCGDAGSEEEDPL